MLGMKLIVYRMPRMTRYASPFSAMRRRGADSDRSTTLISRTMMTTGWKMMVEM